MAELTADDRQRLNDIFEAHEPEQLAARIFDYYHDQDRADRTSRSQMYLHLGMLAGAVMRAVDGRRRARLLRRSAPSSDRPVPDAIDPSAPDPGTPATRDEEVCAIDHEKGPLVVTAKIGAPSVRLALRRGDTNEIVYVTYERTAERDAEGRPIYR